MARKSKYAALYTLRSDGRYQGAWYDAQGKRHLVADPDPERLHQRLAEKSAQKDKPTTFADAADAWQGVRFEQLAYKTVEAYKPVLRRLVERFGASALDEIEPRDVSAYLAKLGVQGYARRSVQMHRDVMHQIYSRAIVNGMTKINPVDHAEMPRNLPSKPRELPSDDAIQAIKGGLAQPFGLFAYVLLYAGLRRGEALALRYEDIDRESMQIRVERSVVYVGNNPHIKEPKTERGKRQVILLDVLAKAIPQGKGYLFPGMDGELMTKAVFRKRWDAYCKAIGYTITAHQLRHGYATILYEAEVSDKDAQEQMGHSSIELTRNVYTHIRSKQRSKTAAKLNRYIEQDGALVDNIDAVVGKILDLMEGYDATQILTRLAAALAARQK